MKKLSEDMQDWWNRTRAQLARDLRREFSWGFLAGLLVGSSLTIGVVSLLSSCSSATPGPAVELDGGASDASSVRDLRTLREHALDGGLVQWRKLKPLPDVKQ